VFLNPHYQKRHKGGEDAATVCPTMLAVADGVGGWAESGVDPAIYSKRLCSLFESLYETGDERYLASPKNLLVDAAGQNTETGSCTACIVQLDEQAPVMTTYNLGDSGYMILRSSSGSKDLDIFFQSKEQQHAFNFPFQVGTNGDAPDSGELNAHNVENGDIIVLGTDGLWDNLHRRKIVNMVDSYLERCSDIVPHLAVLAEQIALEAEKHSY
jgi:protein phosphatase PTC7